MEAGGYHGRPPFVMPLDPPLAARGGSIVWGCPARRVREAGKERRPGAVLPGRGSGAFVGEGYSASVVATCGVGSRRSGL
jgi:hypothetical protein